jgi:4-amino-4-deoxy-L-arabinose transferase-like glycosyltransferase
MVRFTKIADTLVPGRVRGLLPFFIVLVIAAAVRLWGIDFGLPHTMCRPDEETVAALAFRFFRGHFKTHFFSYPPFFMYFTAALYAVPFAVGRSVGFFSSKEFFVALATSNPWPLLLIDRLASAACGIASVAILYLIGRRLFDRTTARVAATFLALTVLHVRDSHFGVTDVPATCAILAAFLFTMRFAQDGRLKDLRWSAALVGVAASTKYNALVIGLPALAVVAGLNFEKTKREWPTRIRRLANFGLVAVLAFLAMMPFALADWRQFFAGFSQEFGHLMAGHGLLVGRGWIVHLTTSLRYGLGLPLLIVAIAGLVWMARVAPRSALLVGLFPVVYFLMMGRGYTVFARYMLPIMPFLCLTGAWAIVRLGSVLASATGPSTKRTWMTVMLSAIIIAPSASNVVHIDRLLARPDSRLIAAKWLRSNMPAAATVYQSGSIYSQVQLKSPSLFAPSEDWGFDEGEARFMRGGASSPDQPDIVIVQESPLELYTAVPRTLDTVLARDYRQVHRVQAYDPGAISGVFDRIDAFFLPLSGFGGIDRPGPNISIYRRRNH